MAEPDKTEPPSGRRLNEAREKGNVAKSMEINSFVSLGVALLILYYFSSTINDHLARYMIDIFKIVAHPHLDPHTLSKLLRDTSYVVFASIWPFLFITLAVGLIANFAQVGFLFTTEPLTPDLNKLNFITGIQRFFKITIVVELVKSVAKVGIISYIVYRVTIDEMELTPYLINEPLEGVMSFVSSLVFRSLLYCLAFMFVLAVGDYIFQRWQYMDNLKMSKQEVKDEAKDSDGDPMIKARIRSIQRSMARKAMLRDVPKADVIITNPTHLAIALKYDKAVKPAPYVLAKGKNYLAEKIKAIAKENGIPIREDKPLARFLYEKVAVEQEIPAVLYQAVAEIIAEVMKLKGRA